uniref:Uncharacterized protein n=1 Tax=Arundo donax TaxID=35708 RepID=A0A0A8Z6R0_ARUDO
MSFGHGFDDHQSIHTHKNPNDKLSANVQK